MAYNHNALPENYQLGEYRVQQVIGSGGFGITYYAWDSKLDKEVAIKEYLPNEFAVRSDITTVQPKSTSSADDYQWGLDRFLDEARTLARFDHPNINKVYRFFAGNGTAYIVLEYINGCTLAQVLKNERQLDQPRLLCLLGELLSGMAQIHQANFVHRDIKPDNIMFRADGSAVLLDFGAARQAISQRSQNLTSILTPGYAPIEQYDQTADDVGPWSDLYALGIVAYRCVSGIAESELLDAVARARLAKKGRQQEDMPAAIDAGYDSYDTELLAAIDWAMQVEENLRPQSVAAMQAALAASLPQHSKDHAPEPVPAASLPQYDQQGFGQRRLLLDGLDTDGKKLLITVPELGTSAAQGGYVIGRQAELVDQVVAGIRISRRHARIIVAGSQYKIEDLNSTNGTSVNGNRLSAFTPTAIYPADTISLGEVQMLVASA